MKATLKIVWIMFLAINCFANAEPSRVGIFGDVHGNVEAARTVLRKMKQAGVTHVIGTGDFVDWAGMAELEKVLNLIGEETGVPRERVFLLPGNWEHETPQSGMKATDANAMLQKYGKVITTDYVGYGYVEIDSRRVMVSHFPQHPVPREMLPEDRFLRKIPGQAFVLETIEHRQFPDAATDLEIFAHTHIAGHFRDPLSGKLVINVGTLHQTKKTPREPAAYGIYSTDSNQVSFYVLGKDEPVESVNAGATANGGCRLLWKIAPAP